VPGQRQLRSIFVRSLALALEIEVAELEEVDE
jgi:hypothetical protein